MTSSTLTASSATSTSTLDARLPASRQLAARALAAAAAFWYGALVLGQLMFVAYVTVFYGGAVLHGTPEKWNQVLPHGYVAGDIVGNLAIGLHVLFAAIIIVAGALQLLPQLRRAAPRFHRWNGRVYVSLALLASVAGLYLVWVRGSSGGLVQHIGVSGDALLIMLCAVMAVRHARARAMDAHRRWALRLFMAVSAVWFFRVGLMFWIFVNKGPAGFDPATFLGPFLDFMSFAQYLVPLAVLELYLRVKARGSALACGAMAGALVVLTGAMGVGIAVATMGMWLPRM